METTGSKERGMQKYKESGNDDPILRCTGCKHLVHDDYLKVYGQCNYCGVVRFTDVTIIREDEMKAIKDKTYDFGGDYEIDPDFLAIFEAEGGHDGA